MSQVREYEVQIKLRVATYQSDAEIKDFCNLLAAQLEGCCAEHQGIITTNQSVGVTYAPKR